MNIFLDKITSSVIYRSSRILPDKDRRKFFAVIILQIFLGALDLLGVALFGIVGSIAINGVGSKSPGDRVQWLLEKLQIGDLKYQSQAAVLSLIAVSLLTAKTIVSMYFVRRILYFLSYRSAQISSQLISSLLSQPLLTIQRKTNQEILYALTVGVQSLTLGVLGTFATLVSDFSLLLVMAIGLFVIDPLLSLSTFTLFASIAFILYRMMHIKARNLGRQARDLNVKSNSLIIGVLESYRELVVKSRRAFFANEIGEIRRSLADLTAQSAFMPNISKYTFDIAIVIGSLLISAIQFISSDIGRAIATLSVFFVASTRIAPALLRVQQSSLVIRSNSGAVAPTLELIELLGFENIQVYNEIKPNFSHDGFSARIMMNNVSLTYPGKSEKAINNVELEINPGEVIAIVGPSGAGKTSLVDLMLGVIQPDQGEININGKTPLEAIETWPGAIAYMPQDSAILNGTIRENVMFGYVPDSKYDDEMYSALQRAELLEFTQSLPMGVNQELGDRGSRISGGQRQRLAIARALFTRPKLLILDEATSALDGLTETKISNALGELGEDVTVIVIAHRLSTILNADKVVYIDNGQVLAQGSFEEVKRTIPEFAIQAEKSHI